MEKSMKKEVLESLKKVVEYMHEFEFKHFEECDDEEKQNHIYKDVLKLQNFLNDS
jgi:reverse gyrase